MERRVGSTPPPSPSWPPTTAPFRRGCWPSGPWRRRPPILPPLPAVNAARRLGRVVMGKNVSAAG